jgi:transcriptional regulator with PAS, ATPase and Fis domain
VLIQGESGTGKELVAQAIHSGSPRRYNPLVIVHLGALAEGVLESELFGHEKGAFTGANYPHKGKFEQADGGTIFLDEIGEISPKVQVELLRVLEEKRVTRVGGKRTLETDFRVVVATNRDLQAMVREGTFREDLYYRLNVVSITIPPVRERPEDIVPLATHFLERIGRSMNRKNLSFAPETLDALNAHTWPGNAREIQNAIERAVVMSKTPVIRPDVLPLYVGGRKDAAATATTAPGAPAGRTLADAERSHIETVLRQEDWNISHAAAALGVDRGTLYAKIKKYGLQRPGDGS